MEQQSGQQAVRHLAEQVRPMAPAEGSRETAVSYLTVHRYGASGLPQVEGPHLILILAGAMRLYTPEGVRDYGPGKYVVPAFGVPMSGRLAAGSGQEDFLALSVAFTLNDVLSVVLELEGDLAERIADDRLPENERQSADARVLDVIGRLVALLEEPTQLAFMARHLLREIIFHVLCGSCGRQFLHSVVSIQSTGGIYEVNSWIKAHFRQSFTVGELAEQKNMSVSQFHQKFKSAVGMGPLQCQKRLRLTEARRLMLDEGRNVTESSLEVGYESVSQFIRDYRKLFGASPREDIQDLRGLLQK